MDRKLDFDSKHNDYHSSYDEDKPDGPVDSRPPQLNQHIPGQGQFSQGCQDMGEGGDSNGGSNMSFNEAYAISYQNRYYADDNVSEDGNERDSGQEGVESNQLRPSGCDCPCHVKMTSDGRLVKEPCSVSFSPRHSVASSMIVGQSSNGQQSPESSELWETRSSTTSEFDAFIGTVFPNEFTFPRTRAPVVPNITHSFLSLTPESTFARIVDLSLYYPMDLSMHEDSESEDSMRGSQL